MDTAIDDHLPKSDLITEPAKIASSSKGLCGEGFMTQHNGLTSTQKFIPVW